MFFFYFTPLFIYLPMCYKWEYVHKCLLASPQASKNSQAIQCREDNSNWNIKSKHVSLYRVVQSWSQSLDLS